MICVTGASGTLSSEVIRQLEGQEIPFRGAYFSERAAESARARGIEAVTIDYNHPDTLRAAFQACDTVFLLGPNALNQTELELNAVDAARAGGVRHIVKQSVMGARKRLTASRTFIDPSRRPSQRAAWSGRFSGRTASCRTPSPSWHRRSGPKVRSTARAVRHGSATSTSVISPRWRWRRSRPTGHEEQIYTLSGPEALTYDEVADELSKVLGRVIRHVSLPAADLRAGMLAEGMPEAMADRMLDLERYFRENRARTITDDVKRVTGRAPKRFADYVRDTAATGVWNADVASAVR